MGSGSEIEGLARNRWRSQEAFVEAIFSKQFERSAWANDSGLAVFAEHPDTAISVNWRGRIFTSNTLLPDHFSGLRLDTTSDASVTDHVNQIVNQQY
jgi:hypothetical protein